VAVGCVPPSQLTFDGKKEPFMVALNSLIGANLAKMRQFLECAPAETGA